MTNKIDRATLVAKLAEIQEEQLYRVTYIPEHGPGSEKKVIGLARARALQFEHILEAMKKQHDAQISWTFTTEGEPCEATVRAPNGTCLLKTRVFWPKFVLVLNTDDQVLVRRRGCNASHLQFHPAQRSVQGDGSNRGVVADIDTVKHGWRVARRIQSWYAEQEEGNDNG